jgi:hypothetical protein
VTIQRRIDELQRAALHTTAEKRQAKFQGVEGQTGSGGREGIEKEVEIQRAGLE